MKRFLYYTLLCCASVALGACTHSDELDSIQMDGGKITISTSLDGQVVTRAADNAIERTVKHIDVFVVKSEGSDAGSVVHYERSANGNNGGSAADGAGKLTLSIGRASEKFAVDAKYTFYLVANATISKTDAAAMTTLSALEDWTQSEAIENAGLMSSWMHVTGTQLGGNATPDVFLMQAIAGDAAGQVVNSSANNGESLSLSASLERAAAKIVVNISQGENVSFYENLTQGDERGSSLYYFNMLPVKSYVLSGETLPLAQQQLVTTVDLGPNESTCVWIAQDGSTAENPKHKIQVVGYAYAHSWGEIDPQDATALVLNIPIKWDKNGDDSDGNEFAACNSWYKIPLSQQMKFERNKCYQVDVVINTAGADDRSSVIELEGIEFTTLPWMDVDITVGTTDRPKYLTLNTDVVKIYNANSDDSQLIFSSSSPIRRITLKDIDDASFSTDYRGDDKFAYYKNKYSQIIELGSSVTNTISATAPAGQLNGNITINSPIVQQQGSNTVETHYNTIRYLEFEVENEQGLVADFRVEQYPLIYITNIVGWYSYRDDFKTDNALPTTFENQRDGIVSISYSSNRFQYSTSSNGFWRSKVNVRVTGQGQFTQSGTTDIQCYYWNRNTLRYSDQSASIGDNARMYHVRVTATSSEYTVARPKIVDASDEEIDNVQNGYTERSEANSRIVSPSFMIASQLGAVNSGQGGGNFGDDNFTFETAREHCKNYVEVAADGRVFDDWRLPTAAEINILIELQKITGNNAAIDELMTAGYYIAASGRVSSGKTNTITAFRCIRDAYDVNDR